MIIQPRYLKKLKILRFRDLLNLSLLKQQHKILNNNACNFLLSRFHNNQNRRIRYSHLRNSLDINPPSYRLEKARQSVTYKAAKLFNELPTELKNEISLKIFTLKIKKNYINQY